MKYLISIIILLGMAIGAVAQYPASIGNKLGRFPEKENLDSSYLECIYEYTVHDPVLDETEQDFKILAIGRNLSKYSDYGGYQIDSIRFADYPNGMTLNEYHELSVKILPSWEAYIKDFNEKKINIYERIIIDKYVYEEPLKLMDWTLVPGSEMICGYKCRKATTSFRGRKWTAWYAPEIPIDNGPWKFGGLPGLILRVESDDNEQKFEATAIRNNTRSIYLEKYPYIKTTREKYNKEYEAYCTQPRQFHVANPKTAPKDKDGNIATPEFSRLFFNPIELE